MPAHAMVTLCSSACSPQTEHSVLQGWPAAREIAFPCFALVFFVSRVVIYPVTVLHFGWYQAKEVLPEVRSELRGPYIVFNALLLLLYLLQLQWMYGIVR